MVCGSLVKVHGSSRHWNALGRSPAVVNFEPTNHFEPHS